MFDTRWRLFRLLGIPISLDASWLIILVLIVWSLVILFRAVVPGLPPVEYWTMGAIAALSFFACILLHELGHAVVARARGMPIRGITLFLFGGVAEMEGEPPSAGSEFLMAVAGPAVSALLIGLFWGLSWVGAVSGWPVQVVVVLLYLAWINTAVLIFNLIPAFPLDGGRVLRSILWGVLGDLRRATKWASLMGQGFAVFLIIFGVMQFVMDNVIGGLWLGLIGLFLKQAAESGYRQVLIREALQGEPVRLFMTREPVSVPPSIDLKRWVEDYVYPQHRKFFPVMSDGRLEGVIETQALAKYPRQEWDRHTVAEVMQRDVNAVRIAPETDALKALGQMQRTGSSRLLVTEGERLVGIVSLKDLLAFLDQKLEFDEMER
jgi:Zn-dependent protease/CBS domain-containing protein